MKKIILLVLVIVGLSINGCASLYVAKTCGGVKPAVRKEMVRNEKRLLKEQRITDATHRKRQRQILMKQNKCWK